VWFGVACTSGGSSIAVYHTYTVMAPDQFAAPYYSSLLERTPEGLTPPSPALGGKTSARTNADRTVRGSLPGATLVRGLSLVSRLADRFGMSGREDHTCRWTWLLIG